MKRLFSVFLVIALMVTMAVPCFAASGDNSVPGAYSWRLLTDNENNTYTLTYDSLISGSTCTVYTIYKCTSYGSDSNDYAKLKKTVTASGTVYFYYGENPETLYDTEYSFNALEKTAQDIGTYGETDLSDGFDFTIVYSLTGEHTFVVSCGLKNANQSNGSNKYIKAVYNNVDG